MAQTIASVSLVVREYDEAIAFFTDCLRFVVLEDTDLGGGKRWVVVAPPGGAGATLLLARAAKLDQMSRVGDQTGGRVFLFLRTDDLWRDYRDMLSQEVRFAEEPRGRGLRDGGRVSRSVRQSLGSGPAKVCLTRRCGYDNQNRNRARKWCWSRPVLYCPCDARLSGRAA